VRKRVSGFNWTILKCAQTNCNRIFYGQGRTANFSQYFDGFSASLLLLLLSGDSVRCRDRYNSTRIDTDAVPVSGWLSYVVSYTNVYAFRSVTVRAKSRNNEAVYVNCLKKKKKSTLYNLRQNRYDTLHKLRRFILCT
jgi:hypothetical protein